LESALTNLLVLAFDASGNSASRAGFGFGQVRLQVGQLLGVRVTSKLTALKTLDTVDGDGHQHFIA
jgi:hypothetical protein